MWLVLGAETDQDARWAVESLHRRGLTSVMWVSAEALAHAVWVHQVGAASASFAIELPDVGTLRSAELRGAINRLRLPTQVQTAVQAGGDADYAWQELYAFYLSWLQAIPGPVLNPAQPRGLSGALRHPSEWMLLAARAGLRCAPYVATSRDGPDETWWPGTGLPQRVMGAPRKMIVVVGGTVVVQPGFEVPSAVRDAALALSRLADSPLLGLYLALLPDGLVFAGAEMHPPLASFGDEMADALASALLGTGTTTAEDPA